MTYYFGFIVALFATIVITPPLMQFARRLGLVDPPGGRKKHSEPVPRIGGVAIIVGSMFPVVAWMPMERDIRAMLLGVLVLLLFGVWDDLKSLSSGIKFVGQTVAAMIVVFYGGVLVEHVPFGGLQPLPSVVSIPFTIFALLGITNAVNMTDGLDGLAGGVVLISLAMISVLAHIAIVGNALALVALAIGGALLGFLRYNTYPARIFMGDVGSQFLGFTLGVLVIILTHKVHPALSPMVAVLILGVPILDTFFVMAKRIKEGVSLFRADRNHLHHRLLKLGLDHYEAVFVLYVAQAVLVFLAYWFRYKEDWVLVLIYTVFCLTVICFVVVADKTGWQFRYSSDDTRVPGFGRYVDHLRATGWLSSGVYYFVLLAVLTLFVSTPIMVHAISMDIGITAGALFAILGILLASRGSGPARTRLAVYITSAFVVYLLKTQSPLIYQYQGFATLFFILLAVAVVIGVHSYRRQFRVTTLDFLIVFFVLAAPLLPGVGDGFHRFSDLGAQLIVLFYASELLLSGKESDHILLKVGALASLALMGAVALTGS